MTQEIKVAVTHCYFFKIYNIYVVYKTKLPVPTMTKLVTRKCFKYRSLFRLKYKLPVPRMIELTAKSRK